MVDNVADFKMPEKVITKLLKDALPDNVTVSKDAKNAACRIASIFILQLSIAAAEKAQNNRRRHLDNRDIIDAVSDLGLEEYAPQLVRFGAQRKRNAKRKESNIVKSKTSKTEASSEATDMEMDDTPQESNTQHDSFDGPENDDQEDTPQLEN